jgi:ABC-2 type transport system permease protein
MKKLFLIGIKDLKLAFRDKAALIFMLLAPFALTVGMGFVTGRFSGGNNNSGISDIPVVIVNQDGGQLGNALVDVFQSEDLAELVEPTLSDNPIDARQQVENNTFAAAIVIPAGFTESIIPSQGQNLSNAAVQIELYTNPTTPTSAGVIKTILEEFISQVEVGRVGGQVAVTQLVTNGLIQVQEAAQVGATMGASQANAAAGNTSITLDNITSTGEHVQSDILAILAPAMALMFLMFTVSNGGRSLLIERNQGTLPRLLVSPTTSVQVLGGKVIGIFLTGAAQMLILIIGTSLMFGVQWGNSLAVLALVLAAVFGAVGWGMLITSMVKTPGQVSAIGAAIMLTFGILGGSFTNTENMPEWFRIVTRITPNAWGVDGFTTLALGGGLQEILTHIIALLIMGVLLFTVSALLFNRRGMIQH